MEIDLVGGDPYRFTVPTLTATADPDGELIAGRASPGSQLVVSLSRMFDGGATPLVTETLQVPPDGRWSVDLAGRVDVEPDVYARVDATVGGHRFYVYTAPRRLKVNPTARYVDLVPYIGYRSTFTITTAAGRTAAVADRALFELEPPVPRWESMFHFDRFDDTVRLLPGDTVTWRNGGDVAQVEVQPLSGRIHIGDDRVIGRTAPGGRVRIATSLNSALSEEREIVADANGVFQHRFAETDLRYNDQIYLTLLHGRHEIVNFVDAPGLVLDMSAGLLSGHVEPSVHVEATVLEDRSTRASARSVTDIDGEFEVELATTEGRVPEFAAGQRLRVSAPMAELTREIDWRLPPMDVWYEDALRVGGMTEPDALLYVDRGMSPINRSRYARGQRVTADSTGRWAVTLGELERAPGAITRVDAVLPSGHVAERRLVEPIVAARMGTDQVCGYGAPDAEVEVWVVDGGGETLARSQGYVSRVGGFDLRLAPEADPSGTVPDNAFVLAPGQQIRARIGDQQRAFDLGPLDISADLEAGTVRVETLPEALMIVRSPGRSCLRHRTFDDIARDRIEDLPPEFNTRADVDGRWERDFELQAIDFGLDVTVFTPEGHAMIGTVYPRPSGTAWIGEGRLTGRASPGREVRITVTDPDGRLRGEGKAMAGADLGRFQSEVLDASGEEIAIHVGDRVVATIGGDDAELVVEDLSFDFDLERGIQVLAPPDRRLEIRFVHPSGEVWTSERTDASGRFTFAPDDVPPRAGWTMADLTAVEVVLPGESPLATGSAWYAPDVRGRTLWLPWTTRSVR